MRPNQFWQLADLGCKQWGSGVVCCGLVIVNEFSTMMCTLKASSERRPAGSDRVDGFSGQPLVSFFGRWMSCRCGGLDSGARWPLVQVWFGTWVVGRRFGDMVELICLVQWSWVLVY